MLILDLLGIILKENYFLFEDTFYIQVQGTAMGSNVAPTYANIFMARFEEEFIYPHPGFINHGHMWVRYIDDVFLIWLGDVGSLLSFISDINKARDTIGFTCQFSDISVNFLDTTISVVNNRLESNMFTKPTDRNNLLHYSSFHPHVYLIKCPCGLGYVSETTQQVKDRIRQHKAAIRRGDPDAPVAHHFTQAGHNASQLRLQDSAPGCHLSPRGSLFQPKYTQDGDIIIGGIFTVNTVLDTRDFPAQGFSRALCVGPLLQNYRHLLAFIFAIDEINRNPDILPNVTLGYHAYDSCADVNKAIESVIQILSGPGKTAPNYSCMQHGKLAGFIGDLSSLTSLPIAQTLRIYGYSQISYGATDPLLGNKLFYPSFFQTLQNDQIQYKAISKLLRHFGWTWVGIIASDDEGGETQSQELEKEATNYGICIEFILKIARPQNHNKRVLNARNTAILQSSTSQVVVLCGAVSLPCIYSVRKECAAITEKTLIVPATWTFYLEYSNSFITPFNGSLSFTRPRKNIPAMKDFLENVNPASRPHDQLLEHMWTMYLKCLSSNPNRNRLIERLYNVHLYNCTGKERLTDTGSHVYNTHRFGTTYHVYVAVYAMAHALHKMHLSISRNPAKKHQQNYEYKQQLQNFIRGVRFKDPTGEDVYFNEKGEMATLYHIINRFVLANGTFLVRHVGSFNTSAPEGEQLIINQSDIMWKHNLSKIPRSQCSENCLPGYRKVSRRGQPACCYDCIRCSMGEISNQTDSESCQKCPGDRWPNEKKNKCVLKSTEFLSYKRDPIAAIFSVISVFFSIITAIILRIFNLFRDTPIVKANNHNLSLILLVSIMLSFLCVFLFLGRPVDITCRLRQTSFGIIFSVAVSSVLAKTIMVCIAFKATKPGNTWKKWMGVKISNCVVFNCSFIQVLISVSWLAISPPFQELNTHSYPGKIIIQCNEGSVVAFYTVLGYLGFLAAASFIVAFLARKLPDSFNEAKYITFSMLVFCSVWVSVIPAYLSVMGKNMVIVEIFAILASSAGILSCIFFPKCYIMLMRPDLNTKSSLLRLRL
ncbi:vomeronasal type-2 receptor 26-like [Ascaphus truei]|uniref:vomeronasal type-2 receptor 26-like n=1 Tax=Ascaphus truei TaxID=8439 RepID=UPI003F59CF78